MSRSENLVVQAFVNEIVSVLSSRSPKTPFGRSLRIAWWIFTNRWWMSNDGSTQTAFCVERTCRFFPLWWIYTKTCWMCNDGLVNTVMDLHKPLWYIFTKSWWISEWCFYTKCDVSSQKYLATSGPPPGMNPEIYPKWLYVCKLENLEMKTCQEKFTMLKITWHMCRNYH